MISCEAGPGFEGAPRGEPEAGGGRTVDREATSRGVATLARARGRAPLDLLKARRPSPFRKCQREIAYVPRVSESPSLLKRIQVSYREDVVFIACSYQGALEARTRNGNIFPLIAFAGRSESGGAALACAARAACLADFINLVIFPFITLRERERESARRAWISWSSAGAADDP